MSRMSLEEFSRDKYIQDNLPDVSKAFIQRHEGLDRLADCIEYLGTISEAETLPETLEIILTAFDRLTQHLAFEADLLNSDVDDIRKVVEYVRLKDMGALNEDNT